MELTDLQLRIGSSPAILLYFYNDQCAPCLSLRPKVTRLLESKFPLIEMQMINATDHLSIASSYGVFSSPAILVFFEGKEVFRGSKYIGMNELEDKLSRYYSILFDTSHSE